jgi:hypothetical protein
MTDCQPPSLLDHIGKFTAKEAAAIRHEGYLEGYRAALERETPPIRVEGIPTDCPHGYSITSPECEALPCTPDWMIACSLKKASL